MELALMFVSFIILMLMGIPVVFTLSISSLVYLLFKPQMLMVIPQRMLTSLEGFVFVAVPLYVLAGEIMNTGGITRRLVNVSKVFVGRFKGGLAYVNTVTSMLFGGIQGLATSDTAALGSILIPAMKKEGYDLGFSTAVTISTSAIGAIIPPSLLFIIYGMATGVSVGGLFLGGLLPGVFIGLGHMAYIYMVGLRGKLPPGEAIPFRKSVQYMKEGLPTLLLPLIILSGIATGIFTATESAGIAVFYAIVLAVLYKMLTLKQLPSMLFRTARLSGAIMLFLSTGTIFGWILTVEQIPNQLTNLLFAVSTNRFVLLLLLNVVLIAIGTFMDPTPMAIILGPIVSPALQSLGMHPIHIGVFVCYNLILGHVSPPVGSCLYIGAGISGLSLEKISKALVPFMILDFVILMVITYVPDMTMLVPRLVMGL